MDYDSLTLIKEHIEEMTKFHQLEVLAIFKKNNKVILNENKNGIFINLSEVDYITICELKEYIQYVNTQETNIKYIENKKKAIEKSYFNQDHQDNQKYQEDKDNKDNTSNLNYSLEL